MWDYVSSQQKVFLHGGRTPRAHRKKKNRSENFLRFLQNYGTTKRNKEVKTSPAELGNCCQEWAGPPAVMRQHWVRVCINTDTFLHAQPSDQKSRRGSEKHRKLPRRTPSIAEAQEHVKDIGVHLWLDRPCARDLISSNLQRIP